MIVSTDDVLQGGPRRVDAILQLGGIETAHRMLHDEQPRLDLASLGLSQNQRPECFSRDDVSHHAALCEFDAVVETPR